MPNFQQFLATKASKALAAALESVLASPPAENPSFLDPEPPVSKPFESLLAHAVTWWEAEEKYAARLALRVNLLMTIIVGFLGLGLFRFGSALRTPLESDWFYRGASGVLLIVGLTLLAWAMGVLLGVSGPLETKRLDQAMPDSNEGDPADLEALNNEKNRRKASASFSFAFHPKSLKEEMLPQTFGPDDFFRSLAFDHTYRAAQDLALRNEKERARVKKGQGFFYYGMVCILGAVVLYVLSPVGKELPNATEKAANSDETPAINYKNDHPEPVGAPGTAPDPGGQRPTDQHRDSSGGQVSVPPQQQDLDLTTQGNLPPQRPASDPESDPPSL